MYKTDIFKESNIKLNVAATDKFEAIKEAGKVLVKNGYVKPEYIESMNNRENIVSTYLGNFVAIPHGEDGSQDLIIEPGISLIILKDDIYFDEDGKCPVKILFGIASKNEDHLDILSKIAIYISEVENVIKLVEMKDAAEIIKELETINL